MTPKSVSVSSSGVNIVSATSSNPAHAHALPARHAGILPHISWYAFINPGTCIHSVLGFFNCMSYTVLNMKRRDFLALQVWISSSGFRVVSFNKNKMLESNLSN